MRTAMAYPDMQTVHDRIVEILRSTEPVDASPAAVPIELAELRRKLIEFAAEMRIWTDQASRSLDWLRSVSPGVSWERRDDEFFGTFFDPTASRVVKVVERLQLEEVTDTRGRTWAGMVDGWKVRLFAKALL